jgi:hypothetical protein
MLPSIVGASPHAMTSLVITTTKKRNDQSSKEQQAEDKKLMRRMVSSEFSAPTKTTINGHEMSAGYRRLE